MLNGFFHCKSCERLRLRLAQHLPSQRCMLSWMRSRVHVRVGQPVCLVQWRKKLPLLQLGLWSRQQLSVACSSSWLIASVMNCIIAHHRLSWFHEEHSVWFIDETPLMCQPFLVLCNNGALCRMARCLSIWASTLTPSCRLETPCAVCCSACGMATKNLTLQAMILRSVTLLMMTSQAMHPAMVQVATMCQWMTLMMTLRPAMTPAKQKI